MKKNIFSLIAAAIFSTMIVGCGGGDDDLDDGTPINPIVVDESIDSVAFTELRDVSGDKGYMLSVNIADALDPADNITYYFCENKFFDNNDYLATYENSYDYDAGFIEYAYSTRIMFYSKIGRYTRYEVSSSNGQFLEGEIYPLFDEEILVEGTIEINSISEIDCSSIPKDS